jgi:hypothetical protein
MNALTLRELELRRAQLAERAERLRQEWRKLPTGQRALVLGKEVAARDERAADLSALLRMAEGMS